MAADGVSLRSAFTLTELLIVVAIISILAAIALPNYQNAQIKAKVAKSHTEMRAIGIALEMYQVDNNAYPPWTQNRVEGIDDRHPNQIRYYRMTTPVSYLGEMPIDPFSTRANAFDYEKWGWAYDFVDSFDSKNGLVDPDAWGGGMSGESIVRGRMQPMDSQGAILDVYTVNLSFSITQPMACTATEISLELGTGAVHSLISTARSPMEIEECWVEQNGH